MKGCIFTGLHSFAFLVWLVGCHQLILCALSFIFYPKTHCLVELHTIYSSIVLCFWEGLDSFWILEWSGRKRWWGEIFHRASLIATSSNHHRLWKTFLSNSLHLPLFQVVLLQTWKGEIFKSSFWKAERMRNHWSF